MKKIKYIDLFSGCGGLSEGLLKTDKFSEVAAVEWLKPQVNTLRNRLATKWDYLDSSERVLHFDLQREDELFNGWDDDFYGRSKGLDYLVNKEGGIDIIVGGPPCQAYSIAGRVRDENGMKDDYRNYLFEHYLSVVKRYSPKIFVFENVPGMLSAKPGDKNVTDLVREGFNSIGYEIISDLKKYALINSKDFGVPQSRKRVIILGIKKDVVENDNLELILEEFYTKILPKYSIEKEKTVFDAIGDLPKFNPVFDESLRKKKIAYVRDGIDKKNSLTWHSPRYHSIRDIEIFEMLAKDLEEGTNLYTDSKAISKIYEDKVGSKSPIHRYHVLRPDRPSTTIIAHLYKDGNRFIHYDSKQARTLTPREAARLQSFDDDFDFIGGQGATYQMIGNAVPPLLAEKLGYAVSDLLEIL
ncbi:DNA cytosine methyltransferase [Carnobacterium divergens]|uniref:DNA cytosine methyltransferase n=1 Tax=Carnobacterium divergens TaxID=2748 RepID=UPI0039C924BA